MFHPPAANRKAVLRRDDRPEVVPLSIRRTTSALSARRHRVAGVCSPTEDRVYRQRASRSEVRAPGGARGGAGLSFFVPLSSAKTLVARPLSHLELVPVGFGAYTGDRSQTCASLLTRTRPCEWLVLERANVDHQARVVTTRRTVVEGVVKPTGKRSARHEASLCPQERRKRSTSTRHRSIPACSFRNAWRASRRSHRGVTAASRTRRYGRPAPSTHGVRATAHVCEPFDRRGREPVRALPAHGALPAMLDNTYGHVLRRVGGWRRAPQRRRASPRRGRTRSLTRARVTLVAQANKNWLAQPCGSECRPPWARSLLRWPYSFRTESAKTSLHPSQRTSTEGPACSASAGEVSPLRCTSPVTTSRRGHARQPPRRTRARHAGEPRPGGT